jgi:hypothetical protein
VRRPWRVGALDNYYRRGRTDGYTYFIQAEGGGPIKIGATLHEPETRLKAFQAGCPMKLVLLGAKDGINMEPILHKNWAKWRLHGEWFDEGAPGLLEFATSKDPF